MLEFLRDFFLYLKMRKRYWLVPILIFLLVLGALVLLAQGTVVTPFIYTLF